MDFYQLHAQTIQGKLISFDQFKGKVVLIVNTATHCGYTKQYLGLQMLYDRFHHRGLEILDFPSHTFLQTPESNEDVEAFCQRHYPNPFLRFEKTEVNGPQEHPVFHFLKRANQDIPIEDIEWNFTKFLINRKGQLLSRHSAKVTPEMLIDTIDLLLS